MDWYWYKDYAFCTDRFRSKVEIMLILYSSVSNFASDCYFFLLCLRAVVSNFRESGDRSENSNFYLFAPKDPFGELFSKIIFKSSSVFLFWQKLGKFEIGLNATDGPIEIMQITTFLELSFKTR